MYGMMSYMTNMLMGASNGLDPLGEARAIIQPILIVLMVVLAIAVTVIILMQKATSDNIGSIAGGNNDSTMDGKNKTRSKDKTLKITTIVLGACLLVVSVVYFILASIG